MLLWKGQEPKRVMFIVRSAESLTDALLQYTGDPESMGELQIHLGKDACYDAELFMSTRAFHRSLCEVESESELLMTKDAFAEELHSVMMALGEAVDDSVCYEDQRNDFLLRFARTVWVRAEAYVIARSVQAGSHSTRPSRRL